VVAGNYLNIPPARVLVDDQHALIGIIDHRRAYQRHGDELLSSVLTP
jgi:hypothetical protein